MKPTAHPSSTHPLYPSERASDRTLDAATFQAVEEHKQKFRAANDAAYEAYLLKKAAKANTR